MWQFMMGFGVGVYVGTKYDCKPTISFLKGFVEKMANEIFVFGKGKVQWSGQASTFHRDDKIIYNWLGL